MTSPTPISTPVTIGDPRSTRVVPDLDELAGKVSYYKDVRPIFAQNCNGCHQPAKPQ